MKQHHLILGGTGFIGRHVAIALAFAGHRVTLADRAAPGFDFPLEIRDAIGWTFLELGAADWDTLVADADVVHHYAWGSIPASANANPNGDLVSNVGMTLDLLEALRRRGNGRILFSSSGGTVYGKLHSIPVTEDHPVAPITAYGAGKATAEIYLNLYRDMHQMDCRIARIANPYGAGQDLSRGLGAVTTFLQRALTGKPIEIWGDGEVIRDYIHISDVVDCMVMLACSERHPTEFIFNVASGKGTSLNQIVAELQSRLPQRLVVNRVHKRSFDVPVSVLSIEKAEAVLGWTPRWSFSEGISITLSDLQNALPFSTLHEILTGPAG